MKPLVFLPCFCYWNGCVCLTYLVCKAFCYMDSVYSKETGFSTCCMKSVLLFCSQTLCIWPLIKQSWISAKDKDTQYLKKALLLQWRQWEHEQGPGVCAHLKSFDLCLNALERIFGCSALCADTVMLQTIWSHRLTALSAVEKFRRFYVRCPSWLSRVPWLMQWEFKGWKGQRKGNTIYGLLCSVALYPRGIGYFNFSAGERKQMFIWLIES